MYNIFAKGFKIYRIYKLISWSNIDTLHILHFSSFWCSLWKKIILLMIIFVNNTIQYKCTKQKCFINIFILLEHFFFFFNISYLSMILTTSYKCLTCYKFSWIFYTCAVLFYMFLYSFKIKQKIKQCIWFMCIV